MPNQTTAVLLAALSSCAMALAQGPACEPQRFFPDFQPTSLEFGVGVAMNDEHLLVADRYGEARIYAYQRDPISNRWMLARTVPGGGVNGSLSLAGNRFITGSYDVERYGGALIYEFDGEEWAEMARLESPDIASLSPWGKGVVIYENKAALANWGSMVLAFREEAGTWTQVAELRAMPDIAGPTDFGNAMAMDHRFFFIGAPGEHVGTGRVSGAVYVYEWDADGRPVPFQKLTPPPVPTGPRLGTSLAVDGDTLVAGARLHYLGPDTVGAAFIYRFDGSQWVEDGTVLSPHPSRGDYFGYDVAVRGGVIAVGALGDAGPTSSGFGAAHLYTRGTGGVWTLARSVYLEGASGFDYAESVALSDTQLAVGGSEVYHMGEDQGVADVYELDCLLCKPDLDLDGTLTVFDFLLFLNLFQDADPLADFDGDGELTIFDFLAFQTAFDAGCD